MADKQNSATSTGGAFVQHPCPSCGHCPTCGRGGYRTYPYQPYYPWWSTQPYYGTLSPNTTWRVTNTTSANYLSH